MIDKKQKAHILSSKTAVILALASVSGVSIDDMIERHLPKSERDCSLKSCPNKTTHNGGYCSARCCKYDKP